ncbi:hypothetical protein B7494_g2919 [Chlorociboria aeruginascens]|nr:hypothetical protein B7494_g2919 [Chlorociboria aeruginascens]
MLSINNILAEPLKSIILQDDSIPAETLPSTKSPLTETPYETTRSETANAPVLVSFDVLITEALLSTIPIPPASPASPASTLIRHPARPSQHPLHHFQQLASYFPLFLSFPPKPRVTFHFAEHNILALSDPQAAALMPDPPLTSRGQQQCLTLLKTFPHFKNITHILVSPLTRTLETLLLGFAPLLGAQRSSPAIAWPELRERGFAPCNVGQKLEVVERMVRGKGIDLSLLSEGWELDGKYEIGPNSIKVKERVERVKKELMELGVQALRGEEGLWKGIKVGRTNKRGDVEMLVVGHGAFLSRLTGGKDTHYTNAELRSFMFATNEQIQKGADPMDLLEIAKSKCTSRTRVPDTKDFEKIKESDFMESAN